MNSFAESARNTRRTNTWTFSGSSFLVSCVKDLRLWDLTHHISRYEYRLSKNSLIDSESKSRCSLQAFSLLHEQLMWNIWFSHGMKSLNFCASSHIHRGRECHTRVYIFITVLWALYLLLCFFHLIDQNAKSKVIACFNSEAEGNVWLLFRKDIVLCRDATTEQNFYKPWIDMLEKTFPP